MFRQHRGQSGKIIEIILILAGAIVLFLFFSGVFAKSTFDEAINTCRFSVIGQVATELKPGISGMKSPFNINCEKRYIHFYNTKVELGLNPTNMQPRPIDVEGKKVSKFKELTDFDVDQVIAEEMRICKYEFADGKVEVFTNNEAFWSNKNVCFVCSEIDFDPTVSKKTFNTLVEYTNKTTFDNTQTSYYTYLTEKSVSENIMWIQPTYSTDWFSVNPTGQFHILSGKDKDYANLNIDTSKKYAVFFEKFKPAKISTASKYFWVAIVPMDEINNYCDIQAT